MAKNSSRRDAIKNMVAGTAAFGAAGIFTSLGASAEEPEKMTNLKLKGTINHSVCRWCYQDIPLEELCLGAKKIGFSAIDLVGPKDWPTLKSHDIYSSMCNGAEISLTEGWNHPEYH